MQEMQETMFITNPHISENNLSAGDAGDEGLIRGLERSSEGGNANPFQYSCLENSMDRGGWWAIVYGITKSQTQLSD